MFALSSSTTILLLKASSSLAIFAILIFNLNTFSNLSAFLSISSNISFVHSKASSIESLSNSLVKAPIESSNLLVSEGSFSFSLSSSILTRRNNCNKTNSHVNKKKMKSSHERDQINPNAYTKSNKSDQISTLTQLN